MADPVEVILEFLQRHQFAKAEAAFKAELLSRNGGSNFSLPENVAVWDQQVHSCCRPPSGSNGGGATDAQKVSLPLEKGHNLNWFGNKESNSFSTSKEEARSPPEKQLYVEYEPGKHSFQDSFSTSSQEFAFGDTRILSGHEASVLPATGDQVSFPTQNLNSVLQGASWMSPSAKGEECSHSMRHGDSTEPLLLGSSAQNVNSVPTELRHDEQMHQQQQLKPSTSLSNLEYDSQQREGQAPITVSQQDFDLFKPELPCNTSVCTSIPEVYKEVDKQGHHHPYEDKSMRSIYKAGDQSVEANANIEKEKHQEEGLLQVHDVPSTSPPVKETHTNPSLETLLPELCQSSEQHRLFRPEIISLNNGKVKNTLVWDCKDTEAIVLGATSAGDPLLCPFGENMASNFSSVQESGELPKLPPVKLHSIDKNMDTFKKDGLCTNSEYSTKSFELKALENLEGITGDDTLEWGPLADCPLGQDLMASGSKRPLIRASVSQGIVEALSEQLSGCPNVADGQSERWYPEEYCDSDTYEDDDDPGYFRQPIEDEEWFLAHEIDYPSDDERVRQHADKSPPNNTKQSRKADEEDRSLGEEESYFSGEEYYRLQAAKKEGYMLHQSELRKLADQHLISSMYTPEIEIDPLTIPGGGDDVEGQAVNTKELIRMRYQPGWKTYSGRANKFDQEDTGFVGYRLDAICADGTDDNYDSVRSGGVLVSSDVADVGSEVRDSLLGGSSEGDTESLRDLELATYEPANVNYKSQEFQTKKKQELLEARSASVQQLKQEDNSHDMVLQYYNEAWGLCKPATDRELARSTFSSQISTKELSKKQLKNCSKGMEDNGGSMFEGFSFPSPSSNGDIAVSTAGSGKSLWSNRESTAQGDEDGYGGGLAGPDDTVAAWKLKSNNSSPIICSSQENLQKLSKTNHSRGSFHSTDDCVSLEGKDFGIKESDAAVQLSIMSQSLMHEEEDALGCQEDMRALSADEDQYEIFDLRIIHRKNRTGFEEDKDFPVMINSVIAGRYHVTEYLGSAAFSKAIQAHDLHTGMDVCMKIIKNNKDFFDQSLDEIKLLKFVNKHDPVDKYHILRLYDYFYHREHLFIVCELLRANLYEFHKFNRESGGEVYFTMPRLQSITRQCLEALEFLHRMGIIHCDLKPENILVKSYSRCEIKIIDLGSSCFRTDHLCSYVQSRSYRAPEVILGLPYDQKIDIWSLGCILAELCTGNVLFQNDSLATLLARVEGILGPIEPEVLAKGRDTHKYFTRKRMLYERNQETDQLEYLIPKRTSLTHRLPMGDQGFVEFVRYLLQSNPTKRPMATEALEHPWLSYPYEPISS